MADFLQIKSLKKEDVKRILGEIEKRIADKKEDGILTEKEIEEIEWMRIHPPPDIQDIQSVYENFLYKTKGQRDR
jgi:hypothetical protein